MIEDIGLIIWGCKGGCRVFVSTDNVRDELKSDAIKNTLKDIRSFTRVNKAGVDFYAVEFTPKYKVYTNYKSSNDPRSGSFIAFTIYVPHNQKLKNSRAILNEMMSAYYREYINPLSGTPIPNKVDDIRPFESMLKKYRSEVVSDTDEAMIGVSTQNDMPGVVLYDDVESIQQYFDSPYRPEFFAYQEVMFMPRTFVTQPDLQRVEFLTEPKILTKISAPKPKPRLYPFAASGYEMRGLRLNEAPIEIPVAGVALNPGDTLSFTINRQYKKPYSFSGLVDEAVTGGLLVKIGDDYRFAETFSLDNMTKDVRVQNETSAIYGSELQKHVTLQPRKELIELNGMTYVRFSGDEIGTKYTVYYSVDDSSAATAEPMMIQSFVPAEVDTITLDIIRVNFRLELNDCKPDSLTLYADGRKICTQDKVKDFSVLLPKAYAKKYTMEVAGCNCEFVGNDTYRITPEEGILEVDVPKELAPLVIAGQLTYKVGNNLYTVKQKGSHYVVSMTYADSKASGEVSFNGEEAWIPATLERGLLGGTKLKFAVTVIENLTGVPQKVELAESAYAPGEKIIEIPTSGLVLPGLAFLKVTDSDVELKTVSSDKYLTKYQLKRHVEKRKDEMPVKDDESTHSTDDTKTEETKQNAEAAAEATAKKADETNSEEEVTLDTVKVGEEKDPADGKVGFTLINCQGLWYKIKIGEREEFHEIESETFEIRRKKSMRLKGSDGKWICAVKCPKTKYYADEKVDERNRENGFYVEWSPKGRRCTIRRVTDVGVGKPSGEKLSFLKRFGKWIGLGVLGAAIVGGGVAAVFFLKSSKSLTLAFENVESPVQSLSLLNSGEMNNLSTTAALLTIPFQKLKDTPTRDNDSRVVVNYGEEGCDTMSMAQALMDADKKRVEEFFAKKDGKNDTVKVVLTKSPMVRALEQMPDTIVIEDWVTFLKTYPNITGEKRELLASKALNGLNPEDSTQFKNMFTGTQAFQRFREMQALGNEMAHKQQELNALVAKLGTLDCTKSDVNAIANFIGANPGLDTGVAQAKMRAYNAFFTGAPVTDTFLTQMSPQQQTIIRKVYYSSNPFFKDTPRNFRVGETKLNEGINAGIVNL